MSYVEVADLLEIVKNCPDKYLPKEQISFDSEKDPGNEE